jgi:hypothetical protein
MIATVVLYRRNDQYLTLKGLKDFAAGTFVNDAIVAATARNKAGAVITQINGLTLDYVPTSNGDYRKLVEDTFDPPAADAPFTITITIDRAGGTHEEITLNLEVETRTS